MGNRFLFSEVLMRKSDYHVPKLHLSGVMHAHCHHKAIVKGAEHEQELLRKMGSECGRCRRVAVECWLSWLPTRSL